MALTTVDTLDPPGPCPFSMVNATPTDRGRALECLTAAIYYEKPRPNPTPAQQAVAQVILNRVRHPAFPATVCGEVVYQGSGTATARAASSAIACDGSMALRTVTHLTWIRAMKVAAAALSGHVFAPVGLATHYHTYAVTPSPNRSTGDNRALSAPISSTAGRDGGARPPRSASAMQAVSLARARMLARSRPTLTDWRQPPPVCPRHRPRAQRPR